jgi:hypothetical protein
MLGVIDGNDSIGFPVGEAGEDREVVLAPVRSFWV